MSAYGNDARPDRGAAVTGRRFTADEVHLLSRARTLGGVLFAAYAGTLGGDPMGPLLAEGLFVEAAGLHRLTGAGRAVAGRLGAVS